MRLASDGPRAWCGWAVALAVIVVGLAGPACLAGEPVKLDKPVRVAVTKADKTRAVGRITAYDDDGFQITDDRSGRQSVQWADLPPKTAMEVFGLLLPKGTGDDWIRAGSILARLPDGKAYADRAYDRALRLDPKLKEKVAAARQQSNQVQAAAKAAGTSAHASAGVGKDGHELPVAATQPKVESEFRWPKLTDEEQAEAIRELKAFADGTRKGKAGGLRLLETKFFLFYTDLPATEAENWAGLLDRMYARLAELFAVEKDVNVWRGKALVFVFSKADDYRQFQLESHHTDPGNSAGMCHERSDGFVHIAFYRQPKDLDFAHVLVHESVHGFIHRYRGPVHIPSWANEGLAEVIATELVPQPSEANRRRIEARELLQLRGAGDRFFTSRQIDAWQYPVAEQFCSFMIQANKRGYVNFINGLKDGLSVDDAFEQKYGAPKDRVMAAYIESMGVKQKR
jgi:cytochrome c553